MILTKITTLEFSANPELNTTTKLWEVAERSRQFGEFAY